MIFFLFNGAVPVYYEITAEASYPIAEGTVTLTITWLMNLFGLVFLCVFMIPNVGRYAIFISKTYIMCQIGYLSIILRGRLYNNIAILGLNLRKLLNPKLISAFLLIF